jgi:hypothetical protein
MASQGQKDEEALRSAAPTPGQMVAVMAIWFFGSTVSSTLLKTGAFEIYLDGKNRARLPGIEQP